MMVVAAIILLFFFMKNDIHHREDDDRHHYYYHDPIDGLSYLPVSDSPLALPRSPSKQRRDFDHSLTASLRLRPRSVAGRSIERLEGATSRPARLR